MSIKIINFRLIRQCSTLTRLNNSGLDFNFLCNKELCSEIEKNIVKRKGVGDMRKIKELYSDLLSAESKNDELEIDKITKQLYCEAKKLPNKTHPAVESNKNEPKLVKIINKMRQFEDVKVFPYSDIVRMLNLMRTNQLGNVTGSRSYFFMGDLAYMEEALIKYSIDNLLKRGFKLVSVPDIVPQDIIENCGMIVNNDRTQIFSLDSSHHGPELCLSGTAEMSLAAFLANSKHKETDLPLKLAAVSRCFRAETSNTMEERGLYRVHQFTKVEMFGITTPNHSDDLLEEFRSIQEENFSALGLHMQVLDMPPTELGAPAYRKYDIEAWMPGKNIFGEISSCSNCTDYQARRLNIKYFSKDSTSAAFVHTLNGTACAIPRMLIALLETHQQSNGKILIPEPLRKYLNNQQFIAKTSKIPIQKLSKVKPENYN